MTDNQPTQHGGHRPGAGRKPSLKPLTIIRLLDADIRAALVALTVHQRQLSGNPQLSQEQVVADIIHAAHRQLENTNNQNTIEGSTSVVGASAITLQLATDTAMINTVRQDIADILARLRKKSAVGQREGKHLLDLLHQLIALHTAQIVPWAILEELDQAHTDDTDRDQTIATLLQRPLAEYRQDGWNTALQHVATQLTTGPIRRKAEQWDFINLAIAISGSAIITNDRIADLIDRLHQQGINPMPWLERVKSTV